LLRKKLILLPVSNLKPHLPEMRLSDPNQKEEANIFFLLKQMNDIFREYGNVNIQWDTAGFWHEYKVLPNIEFRTTDGSINKIKQKKDQIINIVENNLATFYLLRRMGYENIYLYSKGNEKPEWYSNDVTITCDALLYLPIDYIFKLMANSIFDKKTYQPVVHIENESLNKETRLKDEIRTIIINAHKQLMAVHQRWGNS